MKTTRFMITRHNINKYKGDVLVFCAAAQEKGAPRCDARIEKKVKGAYKLGDFSGKKGEIILAYPSEMKGAETLSARRLAIVGLGEVGGDTDEYLCRERLREAGGNIAKLAEKVKARSILIVLPQVGSQKPGDIAECITEGVCLGDYRFTKYKKKEKKKDDYCGLREVKLSTEKQESAVRAGMVRGNTSGLAACEARDMANEPGNGWTASRFASYAQRLAKQYSLKCRVLGKGDMKKLGMGGILGVNQGSTEPPKMVILEYKPAGKCQTILMVGKGLTFDSGGISLKPAAGMEDMKYDMCGGAAVLAAMQAIAQEKPAVHVVAIVPSTDNMSGGAAIKPGDVISHYNGVTSEVINTDAEGRLILADALSYGVEKFKPHCVIDLATLTGAVIVGLGHHNTGLLSNNDELVRRLEVAGKRAAEPLWRLPLGPDYSKQIESKVADIKNVGGREAGTITAAAYLQHFVGDTPWAHLDIAGTAWGFTEKTYIPKGGPSGTGVRTLVELVRTWSTKKLV